MKFETDLIIDYEVPRVSFERKFTNNWWKFALEPWLGRNWKSNLPQNQESQKKQNLPHDTARTRIRIFENFWFISWEKRPTYCLFWFRKRALEHSFTPPPPSGDPCRHYTWNRKLINVMGYCIAILKHSSRLNTLPQLPLRRRVP